MPFPNTWRAAAAFLVLAAAPCVASVSEAAPPSASASASSAIAFPHGVAVVGLGDAVDPAWSLAARVYADPLLRPARLDDATARALAGEPLSPSAAPRVRELAQARKGLKLDDPLLGRMAGSIAADLDGANLLLVFDTAAGPHARLFLPSTRTFFSPDLWQQKNAAGEPDWTAAAAWLHGHALATRPQPEPAKSRSIFKSGWFWGAIGAAATIGLVAASVGSSDNSSDSIHVKGRVGP